MKKYLKENWVVPVCPICQNEFTFRYKDTFETDHIFEEEYPIYCCNRKLEKGDFKSAHLATDPERYLEWIDEELEAENRHTMVGLPRKIYDGIVSKIQFDPWFAGRDKLTIAKQLAKNFLKAL